MAILELTRESHTIECLGKAGSNVDDLTDARHSYFNLRRWNPRECSRTVPISLMCCSCKPLPCLLMAVCAQHPRRDSRGVSPPLSLLDSTIIRPMRRHSERLLVWDSISG